MFNFEDISKALFLEATIFYLISLGVSLWVYASATYRRPVNTKVGSSERCPGAIKSRVDRQFRITNWLVSFAFCLHFASFIFRSLAARRLPWGNLFEYVSLMCLCAVGVAFYFISKSSNGLLWPWVLTPIIGLLFYSGSHLYVSSAPLVPALKSGWYYIHVTTVSLGGSVGLIAGVISFVYILRVYSINHPKLSLLRIVMSPLPSAEMLDRIAYRATIWTLPTFGLGIVFGAIWAEAAWGRFWGWDPKETISFVTWIMYAAYAHSRAIPKLRGIVSASINVVAFLTMVFNLFFINQVFPSLHSYAM